MRKFKLPIVRRLVREERGQSAVFITLSIVALMALSAAGIDTGHVYYAYRLLQSSTNAAALAAGQSMPDIGTSTMSCTPTAGVPPATAYCSMYEYSSVTQDGVTGLNSTNMLSGGSISASFFCSSTATSLNVVCEANTGSGTACTGSGSSSWCNALKVTQTANVNLWFGGLVGLQKMTLTATAEAAMAGGHPPYNIAIIIDTTESMTSGAASNDGCPSGSDTQIGCAVYGLNKMLIALNPCFGSGSCSSTSEEADGVALFVFPAIEVTSSKNYNTDDTVCNTTNPPTVPYGFENLTGTPSTSSMSLPSTSSTNTFGPTNGSGDGGTYQVTGFDTDYKSSDGSGSLLTTDALAIAAGGSGSGSCTGLQAPGGEGTYYAQVIYAAQAALVAQQSYMTSTYNQPTQNIMIILSDGSATACNTQTSTGNDCSNGGTKNQIVSLNCPSVTATTNRGVTTVSCGSATISQAGGSVTLGCPSAGCSGKPLNGTGTSTSNPTYTYTCGSSSCTGGYASYQYPSALGECGQAVQAAQTASAAGTIVYTVAMGAETSSSCTTDQPTSQYTLTGLTDGAAVWPTGVGNGGQASVPAGQACNAIAAMASTSSTFYSDDSSGACASTLNGAFESMASIFTDVAKHLSTSRLIPTGSP